MFRWFAAGAALLLALPGVGWADSSVFTPILTLQTDNRAVRATWTQLPYVKAYHLAWGKEGGGSVGSSGALTGDSYSVVPAGGGRYCFQVYAVQLDSIYVAIVSSSRECVDLPQGGILGHGKVSVKGTFNAVSIGNDAQTWNGSSEFNIYVDSPVQTFSRQGLAPRDDPEPIHHYAIWGQGKITWAEVFTSPNCAWITDSTGRLTVSGQLRTATDCLMDMVALEVYPPSCPIGSCQGYYLECANLQPVSRTLTDIGLAEGFERVVSFDGGAGSSTYTFTDLNVETSTGCAVGSAAKSDAGRQATHPADFTPGGEGTLYDSTTGLTWLASDGGLELDWVEANFRCSLAGMRLPTLSELAGLYRADETNSTPPGDGCPGEYHLPPEFELSCGLVWSSDQQEGKLSLYDFGTGQSQYSDYQVFAGRRCLCVSP